jgi:aminopeptidase
VGGTRWIEALAELAVVFGANLQPGQIVSISTEPGKEELTRAIAAAAYARGAKFVDVSTFDYRVKRARLLHAGRDTLAYVPPWYGERANALGDERAAIIGLSGPVDPGVMEGIDRSLLGIDMLPRIKETSILVEKRLNNWCVVPCPTAGWAAIVHPELDVGAALERLWDEIAHVCRLADGDPVAAWEARFMQIESVAARLDGLALDAVRLEGPGTSLTVGLLPESKWLGARMSTIDGIVHAANIPTEEVFTTPDPERVDGVVTSTKPLFVSGGMVHGLRVRFEGGRAVEIDADSGAETLRGLAARDQGAARLGELALVDRFSRVGQLETVFFDTLLDENAASHIALGKAYADAVDGEESLARINRSEIHVDFMVGSDAVAVTGVTRDGADLPLLHGGEWRV